MPSMGSDRPTADVAAACSHILRSVYWRVAQYEVDPTAAEIAAGWATWPHATPAYAQRWVLAMTAAAHELAPLMATGPATGRAQPNSAAGDGDSALLGCAALRTWLGQQAPALSEELAQCAARSGVSRRKVWASLTSAAQASVDVAKEAGSAFRKGYPLRDPVLAAWRPLQGAGLSPLPHSVLPVDTQLPHVWLPAFMTANLAVQWCTLRSVALLAEEVMPRMLDAAMAGGAAHAYAQIEEVTLDLSTLQTLACTSPPCPLLAFIFCA